MHHIAHLKIRIAIKTRARSYPRMAMKDRKEPIDTYLPYSVCVSVMDIYFRGACSNRTIFLNYFWTSYVERVSDAFYARRKFFFSIHNITIIISKILAAIFFLLFSLIKMFLIAIHLIFTYAHCISIYLYISCVSLRG